MYVQEKNLLFSISSKDEQREYEIQVFYNTLHGYSPQKKSIFYIKIDFKTLTLLSLKIKI